MIQITGYGLLGLVLLGTSIQGQAIQNPDTKKSDDFLFDVQLRIIAAGEPAMLRWSIGGATKVVLEETSDSRRGPHKIGTFGGSGSLQVHPKEDTTYVVTCEGSTTYSCASVTVHVRVEQR